MKYTLKELFIIIKNFLFCDHTGMVTFKNEGGIHIGYCKRCNRTLTTDKSKWMD